jgi:hypothetical protein
VSILIQNSPFVPILKRLVTSFYLFLWVSSNHGLRGFTSLGKLLCHFAVHLSGVKHLYWVSLRSASTELVEWLHGILLIWDNGGLIIKVSDLCILRPIYFRCKLVVMVLVLTRLSRGRHSLLSDSVEGNIASLTYLMFLSTTRHEPFHHNVSWWAVVNWMRLV